MIRRLLAALLRWRSRHHAGRAQIFAMAMLAAQQRRDFTAAAYFWQQLERTRSKRDLLALRASALLEDRWLHAEGETCPPCSHTCNEGRACPARCRT